jgi:dTDP-4-amino-4,6-dideoxygalactose transaminase
MSAYQPHRVDAKECESAIVAGRQVVSLPFHDGLSNADARQVIDKARQYGNL